MSCHFHDFFKLFLYVFIGLLIYELFLGLTSAKGHLEESEAYFGKCESHQEHRHACCKEGSKILCIGDRKDIRRRWLKRDSRRSEKQQKQDRLYKSQENIKKYMLK